MPTRQSGGSTQDQLHIHVGCAQSHAKRMVHGGCAKLPVWQMAADRRGCPPYDVLGNAYKGTDLSDIEPFQLAAEAVADKFIPPRT